MNGIEKKILSEPTKDITKEDLSLKNVTMCSREVNTAGYQSSAEREVELIVKKT